MNSNNSTSYSGQAFWLVLANLISFSFAIISSAILSRMLIKSEYGSYKQVIYIYSTLLTVFTLGLPRAYSYFLARIPIEQGQSVVKKINGIFIILGLSFSLCLLLFAPQIAGLLKNESLTELLRWFSPTPLLLLPIMGIESIMATYNKARFATIYIVLSRIFTLVCVVVPVLIYKDAKSAVIGFVMASALSCVVGLTIERRPFKNIKKIKGELPLKEVFRYSIPLLFASIWGILTQSSPQFFISRWYGTSVFADFSNGFIELPFASMIISAVATVLIPAFSRLCVSVESRIENIDEILRLWNSSFIKSAKIIYPIAIFCCFFASPIMIFLYGDSYIGSTIYFQIITGVNLNRVIQYGPILMALNKTKVYSYLQLTCAVMVIGMSLVYVTFFNLPAYGLAVIYTFSIIVLILLQLMVLAKALEVKISQLIPSKIIVKILVCSSIPALCGFVTSSWISFSSAVIDILVGFVIFAFLFYIISKALELNYDEFIKFKTK